MSPSLLEIESVRKYLQQRLLVAAETGEKRIALTFDDGPNLHNTPALLDLLAGKGVSATFFVVGRRVRLYRDIVARIHADGHELGNHGDHHLPLSLLPGWLIRRELNVCGRLVEQVTGRRPVFMRPPMGWFNDRVLRHVRATGCRPLIGSIHPQDSRQPGIEVILRRIRRQIGPGAVIILHDGGWRLGVDRHQTLTAVEILVTELLADGYRFETVSELFGAESID